MNYQLSYIPDRPNKPRQSGLTMVMDKGLSIRQAEDLIESSCDYVDLIKLGFGTSAFSKKASALILTKGTDANDYTMD
jgi:phosphosulfolactate synthase